LEKRSARFCDGLNQELQERELPFQVTRAASIFWLHGKSDDVIRRLEQIPPGQAEKFAGIFSGALASGIYLPPSGHEVCFISLAHSEELLEQARHGIMAAVEAAAASNA
jgi:glutamate-1-semialdehyde 2,1-aminomutase